MKKLLTLAAFAFIGHISYSQVAIAKANFISYKSLGTSVGGGLSLGVRTSGGVVIGAGFSANKFKNLQKVYTPIFLELSVAQKDNTVYPLLSAKGGYGILNNSNSPLANKGGVYGSISTGVNLPVSKNGSIQINIGYDVMEMKKRTLQKEEDITYKGVSFGIGFKF